VALRIPVCETVGSTWSIQCLTESRQEFYFARHGISHGRVCATPSCQALVWFDAPCAACATPVPSTYQPIYSADPPVVPLVGFLETGDSVNPYQSTESLSNQSASSEQLNTPSSGGGASNSYITSQEANVESNARHSVSTFTSSNSSESGRGQDDDPNEQSRILDTFHQAEPKQRGGEFAGTVILSDTFGWKQKIDMSYELVVRPDREVGDETARRIFSKFEVHNIEISVSRATFKNESRFPQFRIRRTIVSVEPSVNDFTKPIPDDYRDLWYTSERHPSRQYYQMLPGVRGTEIYMGGQLHVAANPSATVELARKASSARNTHPITAVVNLEKSEFHATAFGGLSWEYDIQTKSHESEGFFQLDTHSGMSVVPKSNLPSSMEAKVTAIFDIVNGKVGFPNFQNRSVYRGISIGYRQCKVILKVTVPWEGDKVTRFPDPQKPSSGHQLCIRHQFRGGCENTIRPEKAVLGRVRTELTLGEAKK
jgi:hypothetical protein